MQGASDRSGRRLATLVMTGTCLLFIAIVSAVTWRQRSQLHDQILRREAEALQAVALMQLSAPDVRLIDLGATDPTDDIFAALLESSRLRGVLAVELYDPEQVRRAALPAVPEQVPAWWTRFDGRTVAGQLHRHQAVALFDEQTLTPADARGALFEAVVPLEPADFAGWTAHYWVDGAALERELRQVDRAVLAQAGTALIAGLLALLTLLSWAFARLRSYHRSLRQRTAELAQANQELVLAAKMSAIGALSAHLLHGIKNPILGLEGLAADHAADSTNSRDSEAWALAVQSARRVRTMVNDVLTVLQSEAEPPTNATVPVSDVLHQASQRIHALATDRGIRLEHEPGAAAALELPARTGALATLILTNLLENAVAAAVTTVHIQVTGASSDGWVRFTISDDGAGLPPAVRDQLFRPVRSTQGGSGLGLAISHRLASHATGELALVRSDASGTTFRLTVPVAATALPPDPPNRTVFSR